MRRHTLLMATLAALVGLQFPLCALACGAGAPPPAAVEVADPPAAPCHGESSPAESQPASAPGDDCGCDRITAALASTPDVSPDLPAPVPAQAVAAWESLRTGGRWTPRLSSNADLPPPDLLSLHSILVI